MSRNLLHVRDATPDDAEALLSIFAEFTKRTYSERFPLEPPVIETANAVVRIDADPNQRLVLCVLGGEAIGAMHLVRAPMSPIHAEQAIHITHLHVLEDHRRRGVGRALIEAAVTWAEDRRAGHVLAAASASSRDANRFMARLGLAQLAMVRGAAVSTLRAKLPVEPPAAARVGGRSHRSVGAVLARRRSLRRAEGRSG